MLLHNICKSYSLTKYSFTLKTISAAGFFFKHSIISIQLSSKCVQFMRRPSLEARCVAIEESTTAHPLKMLPDCMMALWKRPETEFCGEIVKLSKFFSVVLQIRNTIRINSRKTNLTLGLTIPILSSCRLKTSSN